jgi:hypothetical protein
MIKDDGATKTTRKQDYVKPAISEVKLRPEEAVLGFCKTTGQSGAIGSPGCVSGAACSTLGS